MARWIEQATDDALAIGEGTLYPALHRLGRTRLDRPRAWGASENNRQAKFYSLTRRKADAAARRDGQLAPLRDSGLRGAGCARPRRSATGQCWRPASAGCSASRPKSDVEAGARLSRRDADPRIDRAGRDARARAAAVPSNVSAIYDRARQECVAINQRRRRHMDRAEFCTELTTGPVGYAFA